jgi:hypothetical protein
MNKQQAKLFAQHAHLPADRQLDVALLTLLGARVFGYQSYDDAREHPYYIPTNKPWRTHQIDSRPAPHFSATWDAAGALVAEMEQRGYGLELLTGPPCDATFVRNDDEYAASAPTAPAAIARAAYYALAGATWKEKTDDLPLHRMA